MGAVTGVIGSMQALEVNVPVLFQIALCAHCSFALPHFEGDQDPDPQRPLRGAAFCVFNREKNTFDTKMQLGCAVLCNREEKHAVCVRFCEVVELRFVVCFCSGRCR